MDLFAYFLTPSGKIINVPTKHIVKIYDDPKMFGYTRKKIVNVFNKYQEKINTEGYAMLIPEIFFQYFTYNFSSFLI
jgi:hypothetical protein